MRYEELSTDEQDRLRNAMSESAEWADALLYYNFAAIANLPMLPQAEAAATTRASRMAAVRRLRDE